MGDSGPEIPGRSARARSPLHGIPGKSLHGSGFGSVSQATWDSEAENLGFSVKFSCRVGPHIVCCARRPPPAEHNSVGSTWEFRMRYCQSGTGARGSLGPVPSAASCSAVRCEALLRASSWTVRFSSSNAKDVNESSAVSRLGIESKRYWCHVGLRSQGWCGMMHHDCLHGHITCNPSRSTHS